MFIVPLNVMMICVCVCLYLCVCACVCVCVCVYRRVKSTSVQTGLDVGGLQYSWPHSTAEAVSGVQYGLAFVNPSSIAATVVSADALEGYFIYAVARVKV